MSIHEIHPEELLDKAEQGTLTPGERANLDQHVATCAACRLEIVAREDFRSDEQIFSEADLDSIIGASVKGAELPRKRAPLRSRSPLGGKAGKRWALLFAAAILLVSAQATARWLGLHAPSWLSTSPKQNLITNSGTVEESGPAAVATSAAANVQVPGPLPPSTVPLKDTAPAPVIPTPPISQSVSHVNTPQLSASALFSQANTDRELGKHVVAADEYRDLLKTYPDAPEADLAKATLGRLLLDDGDAASALPLFDAYLQSGGPLREETMVNRATALERLHREGEEAAAWKALLDAYPESMHAEHARARLKELGAR